ncbi:MAG: hypothetical protein H0V72_12855 [Bradyrhizobium sp.]|nr:hypothetical protein [Bradyrhizobium sp.]
MPASLAFVVVTFAMTSAFAQTATEYYVVRDASTKKCTVVDKKPTTTTTTVVDNGTFKTRTEAETGMKSMKVCTD